MFHDLDFNPQNDRQAEDRCHRLGQTKPVTVYKLVAEGTVDAKIAEMAATKANFADDTLGEGGEGKSAAATAGAPAQGEMKRMMEEVLARYA